MTVQAAATTFYPSQVLEKTIQQRIKKFDFEELAKMVTISAADPRRDRDWYSVDMPFTGQALADVPSCTEDDVQAAITQARAAQEGWARRSFAERRRIFARYHDLVIQRQEELMDLIQLESGKARQHALEEVHDVAIISRHYAYHAERYLKPQRRRGAFPLVTRTWEFNHPVGVVGIIAPWNYPLSLSISDAVPALMAGNSVVLKPAGEVPFTALYAVQLLRRAGLPPELFQVITGSGRQLGEPLIEGVDFFTFTGSTPTGRTVAQQAAAQLIGYSLELGGKNPALILADADLDKAAAGVIHGSFSSAGQLCISLERIYIQRPVYEAFKERLVERVAALKLGPALDFSADIGSLASQDQLQKVSDHVQEAVSKGAKLLTGGRHRPDLGPYFYEPTVLEGVTPEMDVYAQETFGPVISLYPFDEVDEAIRMANHSNYGLNASVWTRSEAPGIEIAKQIEAGTVNINEAYAATWASVDAPMGGMKDSGVGRRHGSQGILKYTEPQTVASQRLIPLTPRGGMKPRTYAILIALFLLIIRRIPGLR